MTSSGKGSGSGIFYAVTVVTLLVICCAESVAFSVYNKWELLLPFFLFVFW
jgi:hypothetical protein